MKKIIIPLATAAAISLFISKKCSRLPSIGQKAPSFVASSTSGMIDFPAQFAGSWIIFFSHPGDFTPVCTTEFIAFQSMQQEFKKLNTELVGLSVDDVNSHKAWVKNIADKAQFEEMSDTIIKFPIIDDSTRKISKQYGMLQAHEHDTKTVRAVFIIDPFGIVRAILYYPQTTGRNIKEIKRLLIALKTTDEFNIVTPANWEPGKDVLIPPSDLEYDSDYDYIGNMRCYDWFLCFKNLPKATIEEKIFFN